MKDKNIIYGKHPVIEALKAGKAFEKILIQRSSTSPDLKQIQELARQVNISVQFVPSQKLNKITGKNHQGVIGFAALIQYYSVDDVLMKVYDEGRVPLFLILDQITDVRNLGAIARTAEGTGVDAIIIPEKGGAMINSDAMKASAGALNNIHVCRSKNLVKEIDMLKMNGIQILAAEAKSPKLAGDMDFSIPLAIVLGSEGKGVSPEILKKADEIFKIPIKGKVESFNVSVVAGMVLYETMTQRQQIG